MRMRERRPEKGGAGMTRISDERLAAAKRNHADLAAIIGEPTGVLDALRDNPGSAWKAHTDRDDLLAEVDYHRAKDAVLYEHALGFEIQSVTMRYMRRFVALVLDKCGPPTGDKE